MGSNPTIPTNGALAQLAEHWLETPGAQVRFLYVPPWSHRLTARTRDFQSRNRGSIPRGTAIYASVAQLGGHLAFNQDCAGSIPVGGTWGVAQR